MRYEFNLKDKIVVGQTSPEDALGSSAYPASGSFIDVSGYEWVNVVVHLGALTGTPVFKLKQAESASGTPDTIDATNCVHTVAASDDDEILLFHLETAKLAVDHHFLTLSVTTGVGTDYADILFYLGGARHEPVTQDTTNLVVSGNAHVCAG
jgi:hypothetical protein